MCFSLVSGGCLIFLSFPSPPYLREVPPFSVCLLLPQKHCLLEPAYFLGESHSVSSWVAEDINYQIPVLNFLSLEFGLFLRMIFFCASSVSSVPFSSEWSLKLLLLSCALWP